MADLDTMIAEAAKLGDMKQAEDALSKCEEIRGKVRERPCVNHADRKMVALTNDGRPLCQECVNAVLHNGR